MTLRLRSWALRGLLAALATWLGAAAVTAHPPAGRYAGCLLADALRALQDRGLRIVFSSTLVGPELRVPAEPRAGTARQQLEDLLAPHGLQAKDGPGGTIQVVLASAARRRPAPAGGGTGAVPPPALGRHVEHVTVAGRRAVRQDRGLISETSFTGRQWEALHAGVSDQPLRVVQAFPGVTWGEDFRSDFAVRGSAFRHVGLVVDGVTTPWLQHAGYGRGATASLTMFTGQVLEQATLRAGAYPRRHGDRLGAELELALREGSRERTRLRGIVGATNAAFVGEGALGAAGRGSWLGAARQSWLEWPGERFASRRAVVGFADALAKGVYDLASGQQLALTVLAGRSSVEAEDDMDPQRLGDGTNAASIVNLAWRSTLASSALLSQRVSLVRHGYTNSDEGGQERDRGTSEEAFYRIDLIRSLGGSRLETGAQLGRATSRYDPSGHQAAAAPDPLPGVLAGSAWQGAAYAHISWSPTPAVALSPGLRVTASSLLERPATSGWLLGEWCFRPAWTLAASAGFSAQVPELPLVLARGGRQGLLPERARHLEVGIEHRPGPSLRWQVTVYRRAEADLLQEPALHPWRAGRGAVMPPSDHGSAKGISGAASGLELVAERRSARGVSGWIAYAYGRARQTDPAQGETFWADFDQRHTGSVFAGWRLSEHSRIGATFRAGSNVPVAGYLKDREGRLFLAAHRNRVRLPPYARLDLRGERDLRFRGRHLTVFAEVINVLDRDNRGQANGVLRPTGEAEGFTDALSRRRATGGVVIDF